MRWRVLHAQLFVPIFVLFGGALCADTVIMRDGRKLVGKITKKISADWVQFTTRNGKRVTLKVRDIVRHVEGDRYVPAPGGVGNAVDIGGANSPKMAEYNDRLKKIKDPDPKGHFELAEWCERVGLKKTANKEYEKTLELDKDHEGAREALGYREIEIEGHTQWLDEEEHRLYKLEGRFVSLTEPDNLADVQQKYRKYVKISSKVSLEEPSRRFGDPKTERNLPVRKMLVVRYRILNRTPLTLEFNPPRQVADRRKWTAIEPGKTYRGEWRTWLYAWREGSKDRPRLTDWEHFARQYSKRDRLYFHPKGIYFSEPVSMYLAFEFSLHGTRWGGAHNLLTAQDLVGMVKCEVRAGSPIHRATTPSGAAGRKSAPKTTSVDKKDTTSGK